MNVTSRLTWHVILLYIDPHLHDCLFIVWDPSSHSLFCAIKDDMIPHNSYDESSWRMLLVFLIRALLGVPYLVHLSSDCSSSVCCDTAPFLLLSFCLCSIPNQTSRSSENWSMYDFSFPKEDSFQFRTVITDILILLVPSFSQQETFLEMLRSCPWLILLKILKYCAFLSFRMTVFFALSADRSLFLSIFPDYHFLHTCVKDPDSCKSYETLHCQSLLDAFLLHFFLSLTAIFSSSFHSISCKVVSADCILVQHLCAVHSSLSSPILFFLFSVLITFSPFDYEVISRRGSEEGLKRKSSFTSVDWSGKKETMILL